MSADRIIEYYKAEVKDHREPWQVYHEEALQVLMMEAKLSKLINAAEVLLKIDERLYSEAIPSSGHSKKANEYKAWSKGLRAVFSLIRREVEKIKEFARRVGYFDQYEDAKYSPRDMEALKSQVEWILDPNAGLTEKLRPSKEVRDDFYRGGCTSFPT